MSSKVVADLADSAAANTTLNQSKSCNYWKCNPKLKSSTVIGPSYSDYLHLIFTFYSWTALKTNFFVCFWIPKSNFEINWPLVWSSENIAYIFWTWISQATAGRISSSKLKQEKKIKFKFQVQMKVGLSVHSLWTQSPNTQ